MGKALPGSAASLMQEQTNLVSMRTKALAELHAAQQSKHHPQLDLIALALHGKKVSFDAVIKMIDDMVVLLKKEQVDDDSKREYCNIQFDSLEDAMKGLERSISDSEVAIEDAKETIKTTASEIEELAAGIKALDKSVAEATENRKEENSDFTTLMSQDTAAKELLGVAKNRLNKFYNPKLYVPPPKVERSQEDKIAQDLGGETAAPTPAPGGIAGTGVTVFAGISAHQNVAPPPAPERPGAFKKKTEESNGVIAMMDALIADLDKEMTVAEAEEKDAQADYEKMTSDSAEKRAMDSKSISEKEGVKADTEAALGKHKEELKSNKKEALATIEVIQATHGECDWLLQNFDVRKAARSNEIGAMTKAKAVLSGADYSLLQQRSMRSLRGHHFAPDHTLLPVGQGAYQSAEAVQQRTTDPRKICEEAKAKGDYSDKMWTECFKVGGDYTDVRPVVARVEVKAAAGGSAEGGSASGQEGRKAHSGAATHGLSMALLVVSAAFALQQ